MSEFSTLQKKAEPHGVPTEPGGSSGRTVSLMCRCMLCRIWMKARRSVDANRASMPTRRISCPKLFDQVRNQDCPSMHTLDMSEEVITSVHFITPNTTRLYSQSTYIVFLHSGHQVSVVCLDGGTAKKKLSQFHTKLRRLIRLYVV